MLWVWPKPLADMLLYRYLGGPDLTNVDTLEEAREIAGAARVLLCPTDGRSNEGIYFAGGNGAVDFGDPTRWTGFISTTSSQLAHSTWQIQPNPAAEVYVSSLSRGGGGRVLLADIMYHTTDWDSLSGNKWTWSWNAAPPDTNWNGEEMLPGDKDTIVRSIGWSWHRGTEPESANGYNMAGGNQVHTDGSGAWYNFSEIVRGRTDKAEVEKAAQILHPFGAFIRGYYWYQRGRS
jgi:hypothetical protein